MVERLSSYTFGSKEGLDKFKRLDLSDVGNLRIAIFGQTGSGKSAFICTCERTLRGATRGTAPIQTLGGEGTVILEDYLSDFPFQLVDTRGFFGYVDNEKAEMLNILNGHLRSGDMIQRDGIQSPNSVYKATKPILQRRIHSVIVIVKGDDIRLSSDVYRQSYEFLRLHLYTIGITPITVVTHIDKLSDTVAVDTALRKASQIVGSTISNTFGIQDYVNEDKLPISEQTVVNILDSALRSAELFIRNIKMNEIFNKQFK